MSNKKRISRCILHIGTEKTGSTSIQKSLSNAEEALSDRGVFYTQLRTHNSRALVAAMIDFDKEDNIHVRRKIRTEEDRLIFRKSIEDELERAVEEKYEGFNTFIISSEHFHSQITRAQEVHRIAELLRKNFEEISVIIYLRPQVDLATSRYSTRLKSGYSKKTILPKSFDVDNHYFNYLNFYSLWSREFGENSVVVRDYTQVKDVTQDFCCVMNLEDIPSCRANESLTIHQMTFIRMLNRKMDSLDVSNKDSKREKILSLLPAAEGPKVSLINREEAVRFQSQFDASNDELQILLKRAPFDIDYSKYPEHLDEESTSKSELFDVFLSILIEKNVI